MHKLRLDLDRLQVESFDTRPASLTPRGTVRANDEAVVGTWTITVVTPHITQNYFETCWYDCTTYEEDMSCGRSCVEGGYNECREVEAVYA